MAGLGRTLSRAGRSIAAVACLVALLIGVPWALAAFVGWPLPRVFPTWTEVTSALNGASISDSVLIKSLACATWVSWVVLLVCVVAEGRAWYRGREAVDIPLAGLIQPMVRELVVSATLLVGTLRTGGTISASSHALPAVALAHADPLPIAVPSNDLSRPEGASSPLPTCVVAPRDSLWKLAEKHLGNGLRWREIWELNEGRVEAGGRHFDHASLIRPGWVLTLPADAVAVQTNGAVTAAPPAPPVHEAARPEAAPPVPGPATPDPTPPAVTTTSIERVQPSRVPTNHVDDPDHDVAPILAGSALLTAGVIACLSRLRRRQHGHREPGRMIRLPSAESARAEVHLRRAAAGAPYERVDLALRALADCLGRRTSRACPAIAAVSVGGDAIEILLTEEVVAPAGLFDVAAEGRAWTLPGSVPNNDLQPIADTQAGPAPALVTIGNVDERAVLVDLEAGARTLLSGDPVDAERLLWTIAVDLATSNRADDIDVLLVGKPPAGLDVLDRVRVVSELDGAIDGIEAEAALVTAALSLGRRTTTLDARTANPSDVLTPTVVLVSRALNDAATDRLLKVAGDNHGIAVVVAGDVEGEFDREFCVEDDTLIVKPLGLRLVPACLPPNVLAAAGDLIRVAADVSPGEQLDLDLPPGADAPMEDLTIGPDRLPLEFDARGNPVVPPGHVLVRVLGPVEIVGGERPIDRRRSIELVVYLALHPDGVDDGRLRTALWPESAPTQAAFNETVSRARRMLGVDPDGNHHVLPVDNRRYRVGPFVIADATLFELAVSEGNGSAALRLVQGIPFESTTRGYEWAYEEGQAHRLLAMMDETHGDRGAVPAAVVGEAQPTRAPDRGNGIDDVGTSRWRPSGS